MSYQASSPTPVFSGEVESFQRKGNALSCKCRFGTGIFETQLPVLLKGTVCPHLRGSPGDGSHLISQGCTGPDAVMKASNWKLTAAVANPISAAYPYQIHVSALTPVGAGAMATITAGGVFLDWFAGGWIEWGTGNLIQRRQIVSSAVPVAGAMLVTVHRYFSALPGFGDALVLYPGCDGQYLTCQAYNAGANPTGKFGNQLNYGADPFTPTGNPSIVGLPLLNVSGTKK